MDTSTPAASPNPPGVGRPGGQFRSHLALVLAALGAAAGLFLAWQAAGTLLLLFAGLLFAAMLDACVRGLDHVLPIGRGWRLAIVCVVLLLAVGLVSVWGGYRLIQQADALIDLISDQLRALRGGLREMGITPPPGEGGPQTLLQRVLPDPGVLFGQAYTAFSAASGLLGNAVVVFFVGLFAAADPDLYRRGILALLPRDRRQRVGEVLDEMAETLRWWLVGQLVAVILIALTTWAGLALIGMPGAFVLGLQAGVVNFIPYLGPVLAAVPIGLAAMAQGTSMVLWALGVHTVIQTVEGYLFAPLIQRRAVDLPPVLSLAALAVFGVLFGVMGVALATPLVAVLKVAVVRLYVEDRLGGV